MGWDFGTQFRDKQKKIFEINIKEYSSKDWEKEYMNIPVTRLGLPELKKRVRELERQMRNIPVCTIQFYKKADELREARKEMQAFIREYNFHILPEIPILISPNITKHLF